MPDFKDQEKKILDFWDQEKIFQKSVDKEAPQGDYLFYDGPPFATGTPHYGHLVASIMKDVVPRFWTMKGYRVARRWGWDCHGLPIENIVEKELKYTTKKEIENLGIDKFNQKCCSKVLEYADAWKMVIRRLGRWVDMDNAYKTMDLDFMESIWWVFKELWDKGLIYEDYRSMHICPRCETTLSQSEVTEGYQDVKDLSLTAKFELVDEPGTYVLAWTTTPWTLIGNVALAIGKDIDYVKIKLNNENFILAKDLVKQIFKDQKYEIIEEFKGHKLIGQKYQPLFDYYSKDKKLENHTNGWQIYHGDFVTTKEGTGIVHIAPAFGEDDMNLGKEKKLPFVQHVKMDGSIKEDAGEFAGLNVKPKGDTQATDVKIIQYLAKKNLLFSKEKYQHSYPHCWRCDTPLLNYATSSWFVNVTKIKDQALKLAQDINWSPAHIKKGRFGKWLEGARDWSISRQRFWASVIPIWQCDKCEEKKVFGSVADLEKASNQKVSDLHKHVVDKITFVCSCGGTMKRIPDVLDCWFESGSMPYASFHYPFENKEIFDQRFPAEFIAEGSDQTRAWFYYLHVISTAIKNKVAYKNVIVNGIVLAEDGKKMSKKLQNYPEPDVIMEKYGADALRMYLLSSPVMLAENLSFVEKDLNTIYRRFTGILQNVLNFYLIFSGEKKFKGELPKKIDHNLDQWIVSKLVKLQHEVGTEMEAYNLVKPTRAIFDFIDSLSTWYVRRSRDRFKAGDQQAIEILAFVLKELAKIIAPFAPMSAEIIYQEFDNQAESVHLEEWKKLNNKLVDTKILNQMDVIKQVAERTHALRAKSGIKVRQPLASLEIKLGDKIKLEQDYINILKSELNIENIEIVNKVSEKKGWVVDDFGFAISLNTNLTTDLKDKGVVREIVRFINSLRKQAGLKPSDNPVETYQTDSDYLKDIINSFKDEIIANTSADSLEESSSNPKIFKECDINGEKITLGLK
ncbi:MAG: isoleucine--tRNA ligase [Candidatus Komeilibacteria bacterium CG11_big_fil_rev_8_21_14_0_20_36_20]|uniref:Isoleucine--tRNA ligase n=1 Tax=Candidatus Komeilibacteria bacterium CG11_big_fil_rev_8_21_14_0_20_36_20 TaxID=1974477 RepID=A0A2H0NE06_9BACT|nr:MAG: isoleucine--tRNA ligase [Candidatus Komeilibacteria bacterium CG11_big_fil_rev_8_21_14_0_20_36_20]PIR81261.1 MAG: isoleucine--tRNA ligase [Candidatus Komeilibacteria bacterium CG10_big_fil_rev_8_21_14_0_10_36_65]PJC55225.1 MAG: isoleucine--tRNA ligase [Candidatus Komeilibacteria bacterium CG_4_9_14_0_2_um_filter_36_13]